MQLVLRNTQPPSSTAAFTQDLYLSNGVRVAGMWNLYPNWKLGAVSHWISSLLVADPSLSNPRPRSNQCQMTLIHTHTHTHTHTNARAYTHVRALLEEVWEMAKQRNQEDAEEAKKTAQYSS